LNANKKNNVPQNGHENNNDKMAMTMTMTMTKAMAMMTRTQAFRRRFEITLRGIV
jgi:hypothetical protein